MSKQFRPLFLLYGHTDETEQPLRPREVTIVGDHGFLREVAAFLDRAAETAGWIVWSRTFI